MFVVPLRTNLGDKLGLGAADAFTLKLDVGGSYGFEKGSKLVYNVAKGNEQIGTVATNKADVKLTVSGQQNPDWYQ